MLGGDVGRRSTAVLLHPSDDWYGADVVAMRAVFALRASGYELRVVLPKETRASAPRPLSVRLKAEGIRVERMTLPVLRRNALTPIGLLSLLWSTLVFCASLHRLRGGVIVVNTSALVLCLPGLRLFRFRTVGYLHESLERREAAVLRFPLRFANRLITVSESARLRLPTALQIRAVVIENAVPVDGASAELPPAPPLRFLFAGRWSPRKGITELLEIWERSSRVDRELVVLGGFPLDGQRAALDPAQAHSHSVRVAGEVADVARWIDASHVVIIPSLQAEGMPMVALEALARGRPLVGTTAGGLGEVIDDSVGWVLPPTPSDWLAVLDEITIAGVRQRQDACQRRHRQRFSLEGYQTRLCAVVDEVAS